MQLDLLWLGVETVVAHANLAVQAAWESENVVAALQAILDEGRVGLLVVLPQEDRIEAEHGLGFSRRDELVPVLPTKDGAALARGVQQTAALGEPAVYASSISERPVSPR